MNVRLDIPEFLLVGRNSTPIEQQTSTELSKDNYFLFNYLNNHKLIIFIV